VPKKRAFLGTFDLFQALKDEKAVLDLRGLFDPLFEPGGRARRARSRTGGPPGPPKTGFLPLPAPAGWEGPQKRRFLGVISLCTALETTFRCFRLKSAK
jgi:hypothetical protein